MKKRIRKILRHGLCGSSTLELALMMPVCLSVFMGIIYLCFFRYDQAVCKAVCCEAVFEGVKKGTLAGTGSRAEEQLKDVVVAMREVHMHTRESQGKLYAEAQGTMKAPLLPVVFSLAAEAEVETAHPAELIRNIRWGRSLAA